MTMSDGMPSDIVIIDHGARAGLIICRSRIKQTLNQSLLNLANFREMGHTTNIVRLPMTIPIRREDCSKNLISLI